MGELGSFIYLLNIAEANSVMVMNLFVSMNR